MIAPLPANLTLSNRRVGVLLLLGCAALWSLNGLVVKLTQADPVAFAGLRSAIAAGFVLMFLPFFRGNRPPAAQMAVCVILHTLMVGFFIASITLDKAARGVLLQYTGPAWVAMIAWLWQGQKIGPRTVAAVLLTLAGVAVMLIFPLLQETRFNPIGSIFGLLAGLAFGGLVVMLDKVDRDAGGAANPVLIIFINNAGTAVLLIPLALWLGGFRLTYTQVGLITFCGVIQHALPYLLFQLGLRRVRPVDASLLILLEPLLSPTWVAIGFGEHPSWWDYVGGAAIFSALIIEATRKNSPVPAHPTAD